MDLRSFDLNLLVVLHTLIAILGEIERTRWRIWGCPNGECG